jgi:hypothetical protein
MMLLKKVLYFYLQRTIFYQQSTVLGDGQNIDQTVHSLLCYIYQCVAVTQNDGAKAPSTPISQIYCVKLLPTRTENRDHATGNCE